MKLIKTDRADVFVQKSMKEEKLLYKYFRLSGYGKEDAYRLLVDQYIDTIFSARQELREYCEMFAKIKGKKPYGILSAHGFSHKGLWYYCDDYADKPVQRWINSNDGKYGSLIISSCNPGAHTPATRSSLLVIPDRSFSMVELIHGLSEARFSVVKPNGEEIDSYNCSVAQL